MQTNSSESITESKELTGSFSLTPPANHAFLALIPSGSGSFHHQNMIAEFESNDCFFLCQTAVFFIVSPETSCQLILLDVSLEDLPPYMSKDFSSHAIWRLFSEENSFLHLHLLQEHMDVLLHYQKLCLSMQKDSLTASLLIYRQTLQAMLLYFARTLAILKPKKRQEFREFTSHSILIEQVKYLVAQNYSEPLSLSGIASSVFTNSSYLSRIFKEETGIPLSYYINQIRIQAAKQLLEDTEELVIDIAVACGYNYIPHFNRIFKEHTGTTPTAYRKECRGRKKKASVYPFES